MTRLTAVVMPTLVFIVLSRSGNEHCPGRTPVVLQLLRRSLHARRDICQQGWTWVSWLFANIPLAGRGALTIPT